MLSKSQVSFIKSLHQKKYRKESGFFMIEGIKSISEFINSTYQIHSIYYTTQYAHLLPINQTKIALFEVSDAELLKISTLQTPQGILAVVYLPAEEKIDLENLKNRFSIVLDDIQDPGNLGTIIRTADWFGIRQIICSPSTVEAYNPKTVQATMGSLSRIRISYMDLSTLFAQVKLPIFGALLDGKNIYEADWGSEGLILLGNEGHGISEILIKNINVPITIPRLGGGESLNVAVSAAIFCSEVTRNMKIN